MTARLIVSLKDKVAGVLDRFSNKMTVTGQQLSDVIRSLEETMTDVEPRFLNLGQSFQTIFEETQCFSQWVDQTIDMAADTSGQSALSGTGDYAKDCVDQLRSQQKNMLESLEIFENVQNGLEALSRRCSDADKIVLLLKVIVLNIGIESNRTKESADMFAAFVKEVRELAGHVDTVIRSLLEDSERIRGEHVKTMAEIRGHVSRLSRLADKADSELKESTKQIETMMAKTLDSLSANRESSEAMARHLGDIVISLQMHDIIRQKAEEVVKELYATENRIRTSRETPGQIRSENLARETGHKLLELAERVDGIILEVEKTYREVVQSFKGIEHHLADLYQGVGSRVRESEDLSSRNNPFSMLSASLKSLNSLIQESSSLSLVVAGRVSEAAEKVQTLSTYVKSVENISLDLKRKALNAIVKAAHLGDMGRGIEVFAHEVGTVSKESNQFAENVITAISDIRKMVLDLDQGSTSSGTDVMVASLQSGSEVILDAYDRFNENAERVAGQFEKIESIIRNAESALVFFEEFSDHLSEFSDRLRGMATEILKKASRNEEGIETLPALSEKVQIPATTAMISDESIMELPEVPSEPDIKNEESSFELFDDEPEEEKKNDKDLGDNVELF